MWRTRNKRKKETKGGHPAAWRGLTGAHPTVGPPRQGPARPGSTHCAGWGLRPRTLSTAWVPAERRPLSASVSLTGCMGYAAKRMKQACTPCPPPIWETRCAHTAHTSLRVSTPHAPAPCSSPPTSRDPYKDPNHAKQRPRVEGCTIPHVPAPSHGVTQSKDLTRALRAAGRDLPEYSSPRQRTAQVCTDSLRRQGSSCGDYSETYGHSGHPKRSPAIFPGF